MKTSSNKLKEQPQYEGGQAAALRDKKKIEELKRQHDLKNPDTAFELYELIAANPHYFESETGRQFSKELLLTAIHSDAYLMDEQTVSGRMDEKEFNKINQAVEKESDFAVNSGHRIREGHHKDRKHRDKNHVGRIKKRKRVSKIVLALLLMLLIPCIIIFGKSIYEIVDYNIKSHESEKKIKELISCILEPSGSGDAYNKTLPDSDSSGTDPAINNKFDDLIVLHQYSELYERNQDLAGWVKISGTNINYPVMQTKAEEEYYLKRDFDRNDDLCGLPFMDIRCEIEHPKTSFLIYGHNMKNGSMFSTLLEYEDEAYYEKHSSIQFDTIYETGTYDIIAVFQTQVAYQDEDTFRYYDLVNEESETEYDSYVQKVKDLSIYNTGVTADYGDQLLILSTCDRRIDNGRFVIIARKRK